MPEADNPGLDALNRALSSLTNLKVALSLVSDHLAALQRRSRGYELLFDENGEFTGMQYRHNPPETMRSDSLFCIEVTSHCEWLPKYVDSLWESRAEVDNAIAALPNILTDKLDSLTHSPWIASARRHCLDQILAWPGETAHQTSYAAYKVHGTIPELLKLAEEREPFTTWKSYLELLEGYSHDLFSVRDAVLPKVTWIKGDKPVEHGPNRATLGKTQLAALEVIEQEGPIAGKNLAKKIKVQESTLRRHIIPALKAFGVTNDGRGYYVAPRSAT